MASINYDILVFSVIDQNIFLPGSVFKAMLVTSAYVPNKKTNVSRADVTNEIVGVGYTAGGEVTAATVTNSTANDRTDVTFGPVSWPVSTITNARAAVIYQDNGGAASGDPLVGYVDFGGNFSSAGQTFTATFTGQIRWQN
jgi:hypothetical protein